MKNIALFLFIFLFSCSSKSQEKEVDLSKKNISYSEKDDETAWIRIKLNNPEKWGFISSDSIVKIPFEYDFVNPFKNGLAYAKKEGKEFFINTHNLKLEGNYDEIRTFSEGLAAVRKEKKWGFINENGKLTIPFNYDDVDYFRPNGLSSVKKDNKWGFIDKKGNPLIPIVYDDAYQEMTDQNVIVKKNGKWAVFDNNGKQLSDFIFDKLHRAYIVDFSKDVFTRDRSTFFENGAALVEVNGNFEFIDAKAKAAFPNNKFDSASVFDTFRNAIVKRKGKFGIIKTDGSIKVPLEYDDIFYFDDNHPFSEYYNARKGEIYHIFNRHLVEIGTSFKPVYNDFSSDNPQIIFTDLSNKFGIKNSDGQTLIPFIYDDLVKIESTPYLFAKKNDFKGLIDQQGKILIPIKYKNLRTVYGRFSDEKDFKKFLFIADNKIIDINNKVILSGYDSIEIVFYHNNAFIVSKQKKIGIVDIDNKVILPIKYDEIVNGLEHGPSNRHIVQLDNKYGMIEYNSFKTIIPPVYDNFLAVIGKYVIVLKDGKKGIINLDNEIICPHIYDEIKPNKNIFQPKKDDDEMFFAKKEKEYYKINIEKKSVEKISGKEYKNKTTF